MIHPSVPFKKRLWFGWIIFRIAARTAAVFLIVILLATGGVFMLRSHNWLVAIAFLAMATALGTLGTQQLITLRRDVNLGMREELRRRNFYTHCAYDLRASRGRCPECGEPAPAALNIEI